MSTETEPPRWVQLFRDPAYRAAAERDERRFMNDPQRCWDCRKVEACDCGTLWAHIGTEGAQSGR